MDQHLKEIIRRLKTKHPSWNANRIARNVAKEANVSLEEATAALAEFNKPNKTLRNLVLGSATLTVLGIAALGYLYRAPKPEPKPAAEAQIKDKIQFSDLYKKIDSIERNKLKRIVIESTKKAYPMTKEDLLAETQEIIRSSKFQDRHSGLMPTNVNRIESFQGNYFTPEPNPEYTKRLRLAAQDSIVHFLDFVRCDYIKQPTNIRFTIPKKASHVNMFDKEITIYMVAEYGEVKFSKYRFELPGTYETIDREEYEPQWGESTSNIIFAKKDGKYRIKQAVPAPIFYSTSSDLVERIETPVIELFHRLVRPYTIAEISKHINEATTDAEVLAIADRYSEKEEKFVHGMSIVWWYKYNEDRELGISKEQLHKRFVQYDNMPRYAGANELARKIQAIGVEQAIKLYAIDQDALFQGIE
ncbi:hypothetical protein KY312_03660 [Candidatus Woesearchaeota archaeon]|nr:hypothetical protein [Candidatus Woesearchaeota archaeon]